MPSLHIRKRDKDGKPLLWGVSIIRDKKQHWKHFRREADAQDYLAQERLTHAASKAISRNTGKVPLSIVFAGWIKHLEISKKRARTIEAYSYDWNKLIGKASIEYAEQLSNIAIHNLINPKYSNSTLRRQILVLECVLNFGKSNYGITLPEIDWDNIRERLNNKDGEGKLKKYLSSDEFRSIVKELEKSDRVAALMVKLCGCYGFRIGEITRLEIDELDSHNRIWLPAYKTKAGRERKIIIDDEFGKEIRALRAEVLTKRKGKPESKSLFLCPYNGEPYSQEMLRSRYRAACETLKITDKPFHRLRAHAFYYLYLMLNHDIESVRQVCGWSSSAYRAYVGDRSQRLYDIKGKASLFMDGNGDDKLPSETLRHFQDIIRGYDTAALVEKTRGRVEPSWITHMRGRQYLDTLAKMEAVLEAIGKRVVVLDASGG